MSGSGGNDDERPPCSTEGCDRPSSFWLFEAETGRWRPICAVHARHRHPSLEVHAWLQSGYLKPVEIGHPEGRPPVPEMPRARAFREAVDEAMGWD